MNNTADTENLSSTTATASNIWNPTANKTNDQTVNLPNMVRSDNSTTITSPTCSMHMVTELLQT
jgi:hypothetical protein